MNDGTMMTRREELEYRLNEAEKQNLSLLNEIKLLKEKMKELKGEQEIPDFPKFRIDGEDSWFMNNFLEVLQSSTENGTVNGFNYFHTEDYAEEFSRKCLMLAMMLHCSWYVDRYYIPDWNYHNTEKYYVIFNHIENEFQVRHLFAEEGVGVYFSTEEAAQKCADWMEKNWKDE